MSCTDVPDISSFANVNDTKCLFIHHMCTVMHGNAVIEHKKELNYFLLNYITQLPLRELTTSNYCLTTSL